ncbi:hypothetical protein [Pedobacter sp. Hv1]|uniref:hypothetical protein n=1 Tax=Pedobacter sp. Hv1 TaxID=1740090 RepID=UPI001F1F3830|nr:hypothetical protein [Pedobacter sp. Hv1]
MLTGLQDSLLRRTMVRTNIFEENTVQVRAQVLKTATDMLNDWPYAFAKIMANHPRLKSAWLLKDLRERHFWFTSIIKENFYVNNRNRKLLPNLA